MLALEKFEVDDRCHLEDYEIKNIKNEIEKYINIINECKKEGKSEEFIYSYDCELTGMRYICSCIGLNVRIKYEK